MKKEKVCYILPFFDPGTDTHYYHLYDFIEHAARELDIFLIIERKPSDVSFFKNVTRIEFQKTAIPLRIFENAYLILKARVLGYKKFYIHYSFLSAINSSLVVRAFGGKNWYWSCGMMWLFKKDRLNQFLWKFTLNIVQHLVTGTDSMADNYSIHYGVKRDTVRIMPNWIDIERFRITDKKKETLEKFSLSADKKYVLFVHRLAERKGAHYIVPLAKKFDEKTIFLIVGDGPYRKTLEKEIAASDLKNVKLLGNISNTLIPEIMQMSDVFLMPSEEEGFPRVLIEAMASGLPYVASDIGGVKEISPDAETPYIYPVGDIQKFEEGIRDILSHKKEHFKNELKTYARKYSQENILRIFIRLFQD